MGQVTIFESQSGLLRDYINFTTILFAFSMNEDREAENGDLDHVRTLLTSLLDSGEEVVGALAATLLAPSDSIYQIADMVSALRIHILIVIERYI